MSGYLMGQTFLYKLTRSQREVLGAMADHAYDDGTHVWPSVPYISWKIDMDRRTVQRVKRQLEDMGVLIPVANLRGGRGHATIYEIHLDVLEPKTPYKPGKDDILTPFSDDEDTKGDIVVTPFSAEGAPKDDTTPPFTPKDGTTPPFTEGEDIKGGISNTKGGISNTKGGISNTKGGIAMPPEPSYNHQIEPLGEPSRARTREDVIEDPDRANMMWRKVQESLRPHMTAAQFDSWIKRTQLVPRLGGGYCVIVESKFAGQMLQTRCGPEILTEVQKLSGRRSHVDYVTEEAYLAELEAWESQLGKAAEA